MKRRVRVVVGIVGIAVIIVGVALLVRSPPPVAPEGPVGPGGQTGNWEPTTVVAASQDVLDEGRSVYVAQCAPCHGAEGRGDGPAAYLLYPRPRDFRSARYRLVSTWDRYPTDEDLFRTISRGMPGSSMPAWAHLSERTRWSLVHYVKSLADDPWTIESPTAEEPHLGVVAVPTEPAWDDAAKAKAADLYVKGCAPCHGATGKGDGVEVQIDDKGLPTQPRDLTTGIFKGSPEPEHVYRRILAGLPGSPMPSSPYLEGDDAWHVVHYVRDMSSEEQKRRVEMRKMRITAARRGTLPAHPDDSAWREASSVRLSLMPLWWRSSRPEELRVQAVHDGKSIALLLTWEDETHDHTAMRPQDFRDAAAVQFSAAKYPPFLGMGAAGQFVNLWMWKSERQADLEPAFQELEKVYPNIGIDSYPNLSVSPLEQPLRHALTLESDPTFVTAWGAGNIVADPTRKSAFEDLTAQGFGTLSARPRPDQHVEGIGIYSMGTYRVLFRRSLTSSGERAVTLKSGGTVSVAFAVWNGSAGDRDGKKSVSLWHELELE